MDYCSILWDNSRCVHILSLAQKRAARIILDNNDYQYPSKEMFSQLKWMPIRDRFNYRKAIMVFKSRNKLTPVYMTEMFKTIGETHSRVTRASQREDLYLPGGRHKKLYTDSFAYSGALIWNSLPVNVRNCESLASFKSSYIKNYHSK